MYIFLIILWIIIYIKYTIHKQYYTTEMTYFYTFLKTPIERSSSLFKHTYIYLKPITKNKKWFFVHNFLISLWISALDVTSELSIKAGNYIQ